MGYDCRRIRQLFGRFKFESNLWNGLINIENKYRFTPHISTCTYNANRFKFKNFQLRQVLISRIISTSLLKYHLKSTCPKMWIFNNEFNCYERFIEKWKTIQNVFNKINVFTVYNISQKYVMRFKYSSPYYFEVQLIKNMSLIEGTPKIQI